MQMSALGVALSMISVEETLLGLRTTSLQDAKHGVGTQH
jgi:hypothetical protein